MRCDGVDLPWGVKLFECCVVRYSSFLIAYSYACSTSYITINTKYGISGTMDIQYIPK